MDLAYEFPELIALSLMALFGLLLSGKFRPSLVFMGILLGYYLVGLISFENMAQNFVNPSLITLVLLLLFSVVIEKTTVVSFLSQKLIRQGYRTSLFRLSAFTALSSSILNNTAVVASLLGTVRRNRYHAPSRLLLPLSYAAILGGTMTLVGTSTNLIVNGFVIEAGLPSLELLDFMWVGGPVVVVGILVLWLFSRLLPQDSHSDTESENYLLESVVEAGSPLIGQSVEINGMRNLEYLYLAEILRNGQLMAPVSPKEVLQEGDILLFSGDVQHVKLLGRFPGLKLCGQHHPSKMERFQEVVLSAESTLIGRTIKESQFRTRFDASVVALRRGESRLSGKIADIPLEVGDSLVLAVGQEFTHRENLKKNFYFMTDVSVEKHLDGWQSSLVLGGFVISLFLSAPGWVPLLKSLPVLLAGSIALRFVDIAELKRRFPYEIFLIVGAAIGVSEVVQVSGMAEILAHGLKMMTDGMGVFGVLAGVFVLTYVLTEMMTNTAAAALAFPIALESAHLLAVDPMPFIMVVAYGASASFLTPYGYQTNLIVFGAGRYQIRDYVRYGIPVMLAYTAVVLGLVPLFFPWAG